MKKEELISMRHRLMERLGDSLKEELIAAELSVPEAEGEPEVLNVVLDSLGFGGEGAIGEFYFSPIASEEDGMQYFSAAITLAEDLAADETGDLYEAMSYINFRLPSGSYCIDKDKSFLIYKLVTPLSTAMPEEALYEEMNICVGNAVAVADLYMDLLLRMMDGDVTLEDVIASLN